MGDTMLIGVLRMPMDDPDPVQLMQFVGRARQAADRIEADAKEIERLKADQKLNGKDYLALMARYDEQHNEIERLREAASAALHAIEQYSIRYGDNMTALLIGAKLELRAALAGKEPHENS
jgi:hypothetical protein